jgi:hypothetical protein
LIKIDEGSVSVVIGFCMRISHPNPKRGKESGRDHVAIKQSIHGMRRRKISGHFTYFAVATVRDVKGCEGCGGRSKNRADELGWRMVIDLLYYPYTDDIDGTNAG